VDISPYQRDSRLRGNDGELYNSLVTMAHRKLSNRYRTNLTRPFNRADYRSEEFGAGAYQFETVFGLQQAAFDFGAAPDPLRKLDSHVAELDFNLFA